MIVMYSHKSHFFGSEAKCVLICADQRKWEDQRRRRYTRSHGPAVMPG